jgi:SHS2 domain-containing protein
MVAVFVDGRPSHRNRRSGLLIGALGRSAVYSRTSGSAMGPPFETFEHDADIGVRGRGATLAEAFANAGLALTAVVSDPSCVRETLSVDLACEAEGDEPLLFDWLNALVFEMATRWLLFARFEVAIDRGRLRGRAFGEPVDVERHSPAVEVKGATWTGLRVAREADGSWLAQCVVDV